MSLDWNAARVEKSPVNYCTVGNCTCTDGNPMPDKAHWRNSAVPNLCFLLMVLGYNSIKNESAAIKVYARFIQLRNVDNQIARAWDDIITPIFLLSVIGYGTNVPAETGRTFNARIARISGENAEAASVRAFKRIGE